MNKIVFLISIILTCSISRSQKIESQNQTAPASVAIGNLGPGCRVRIQLPKNSVFSHAYSIEPGKGGGSLTMEKSKFLREPWIFGFVCYRHDDGTVNDGWAVLKGGVWIPKYNESLQQLIDLKAFQFHSITSINATGWAITQDETFGEQKFRRRTMNYCLAKGIKAICGNSEMGYLEDFKRNKKSDLTPVALRVLQSIEFLDDAPPKDN